MDNEILEKMCIVCGKTGTTGIIIMSKKICTCCEQRAVEADINSEFYEFYKDRLVKNVLGKFASQS